MPRFAISLIVPLIPAIMITMATVFNIFIEEGTMFHEIINFLGSAEISLLLAVLVAIYTFGLRVGRKMPEIMSSRSEEHTSELQSRGHIVCRLLLEKKK